MRRGKFKINGKKRNRGVLTSSLHGHQRISSARRRGTALACRRCPRPARRTRPAAPAMSDAAREEMAMLKRRRLVRKKLKEVSSRCRATVRRRLCACLSPPRPLPPPPARRAVSHHPYGCLCPDRPARGDPQLWDAGAQRGRAEQGQLSGGLPGRGACERERERGNLTLPRSHNADNNLL